jgi:energy-converting hydrogenase A subunit M
MWSLYILETKEEAQVILINAADALLQLLFLVDILHAIRSSDTNRSLFKHVTLVFVSLQWKASPSSGLMSKLENVGLPRIF